MTAGAKKNEFSQSGNGTRTHFVFHDGHVKYDAHSADGEMSFIAPYGGLTANKRVTRVRKAILLWAAIGFWVIGTARLATDFFAGTVLWAGLVLMLIACVLTGIYFFKQFSFTAIPTARGQISVLHDNQHDKIIDMLMDRRKKQLLAQYRQNNYPNAHGRRQAVHWLWENEVISETEYHSMLKEVFVTKKPTLTTGRVFN